MQLRVARLCLDCEEVHNELHCPVCASDSYAYLSRWVPTEERRREPRMEPLPPKPPANGARWVKRGAMGLAVLAAAQWAWKATQPKNGEDRTRG
jgi:hypothetical protein